MLRLSVGRPVNKCVGVFNRHVLSVGLQLAGRSSFGLSVGLCWFGCRSVGLLVGLSFDWSSVGLSVILLYLSACRSVGCLFGRLFACFSVVCSVGWSVGWLIV